MSLRTVLADLVSTTESTDVPSETILNVLRTNDRIALGTQEIADVIGMSRQGAENRLNTLEKEGRVRSEQIGRVLVWDLHPDERKQPVPPEIDRLVHAFDEVRGTFEVTRRLGLYILLVGFGLIFTGLTSLVASTPVDAMTNSLLVWGYGIAAGGGAAWVLGGGTQYATIITERVAYWRLTGKSLKSQSVIGARSDGQRGQVDARFILGLIVLVFIGGELLQAASNFQKGLAAMSGVSWLESGAIALCFLGALIAMILGIE